MHLWLGTAVVNQSQLGSPRSVVVPCSLGVHFSVLLDKIKMDPFKK